MSKDEAKIIILLGAKLCHPFLQDYRHITIDGNEILLIDTTNSHIRYTFDEFWEMQTNIGWNDNWTVLT